MQNYVYEKLFCYILFESTTRVGGNSLCSAKTPFSPISVFNSKNWDPKPFLGSYLRIVVIDYNYHTTTNTMIRNAFKR